MNSNSRTTLSVEQLQDRIVPAIISVETVGGNVTITTDNTNTDVDVVLSGDNQIDIFDGGALYGTTTVTGELTIDAGDGDDSVTLDLYGFDLDAKVSINTGAGMDRVYIDDTYAIKGALNNNLSISTGDDDDEITFGYQIDSQVNIDGDVSIEGGEGNLLLDTGFALGSGANIDGDFEFRGEDGNDDIFFDSTSITGDVDLQLGNGDNYFTTNYYGAVEIGGNLTINSGDDSDIITLGSENYYLEIEGRVSINAGDGDNSLITGERSTTVTLGRSLSFVGGDGIDLIILDETTITGAVRLNLGDGNNAVYTGYDLADNAANGDVILGNSLSINSGEDGDIINLDNLDVASFARFRLGNGNNDVQIAPADNGGGALNNPVAIGRFLRMDLGSGNDGIFIGDANTTTIGGNLVMYAGRGDNTTRSGFNPTGNLTVDGSLTYSSSSGSDIVDLDTTEITGNANINMGNGNNYFYAADFGPVTIGGRLRISGGNGDDDVTLGVSNDFSVALDASLSLSGGDNSLFTSAGPGATTTIGRNLSYRGGSGLDDVDLDSTTVTGSANINLGSGTNNFYSGYYGTVEVNRNLTLSAGSGDDTVNVDNTMVNGRTSIRVGSGINSVLIAPGDNGSGVNDPVDLVGDVRIQGGNGDDVVEINGGGAGTTFGRNLDVRLNNGLNLFTNFGDVGTAATNGSLTYRGGRGMDVVLVGGSVGRRVHAFLGGGDDDFTYDDLFTPDDIALFVGLVNGQSGFDTYDAGALVGTDVDTQTTKLGIELIV